VDHISDTLRYIGDMLHNAPDVLQAVRSSIEENAELRKEAEEHMKERVRTIADEIVAKAKEVNGVKVVTLGGVRMPVVVKYVAFLVRQLSPEYTAFVA
ncbi:hypothetical protein, partial [Clostridium sp. HCS.1]|uniref:hypothetical protein n=1 Tax=Clostridium sp. HCS.1 TaxID=3238594 RepID=UPI003A10398C